MTPTTIFAAFSQSADNAGERPALVTPQGVTGYGALRQRVLWFAARLARQDERAAAVALPGGDALPLLAAFLACAALGRPGLILDPARPFAESRRIAERHGASPV
jgi:acyl-CoA synthetase (AMP-forming)/AMP-acid ligase II